MLRVCCRKIDDVHVIVVLSQRQSSSLIGYIQRRISIKEVLGLTRFHHLRWHDRPVLRHRHVMKANHWPGDQIGAIERIIVTDV